MPEVGVTPTTTVSEDMTSTSDPSMNHYCIEDHPILQTELPISESTAKDVVLDEDDEDKTLIVEDEEDEDIDFELPNDDLPKPRFELHNVVVSSPSPKAPEAERGNTLDIVSIHSDMSDEESDETSEMSRSRRIEELARKMLEEETSSKTGRTRHPSDPGIRTLNEIMGELDTVSERSEMDEEESVQDEESDSSESSSKSFERYCRKKVEMAQSKHKGSLRTRSASRERTLARIKYCWRCHQTGHESYDCKAELHPAAWCPRCLESSHWEDDCWVTDKEV